MNKLILLLISLVYYVVVVTTHQVVGRFVAQNLDKPLGRDNYNLVVMAVGLLSIIAVVLILRKPFKNNLTASDKRRIWFFSALLAVLIVTAVNVIMVVNVEIIHIAQYCVLALLLFPVLRNYNLVMLVTTILGALDEAYQYWYLFPEWSDYYDFNDVIINFLGVVLGLIIVRIYGGEAVSTSKTWYKTSFFYILMTLVLLSAIGLLSGFITLQPPSGDADQGVLHLVRKYKPGFWRIIPPQVKFHVVRPFEFVCIMAVLMGVFSQVGSISDRDSVG